VAGWTVERRQQEFIGAAPIPQIRHVLGPALQLQIAIVGAPPERSDEYINQRLHIIIRRVRRNLCPPIVSRRVMVASVRPRKVDVKAHERRQYIVQADQARRKCRCLYCVIALQISNPGRGFTVGRMRSPQGTGAGGAATANVQLPVAGSHKGGTIRNRVELALYDFE
jgi:hypothetical protein